MKPPIHLLLFRAVKLVIKFTKNYTALISHIIKLSIFEVTAKGLFMSVTFLGSSTSSTEVFKGDGKQFTGETTRHQ